MSSPAYSGPEIVAICPQCDATHNVADPAVMNRTDSAGWCPACERMVRMEYWRGPVVARD